MRLRDGVLADVRWLVRMLLDERCSVLEDRSCAGAAVADFQMLPRDLALVVGFWRSLSSLYELLCQEALCLLWQEASGFGVYNDCDIEVDSMFA